MKIVFLDIDGCLNNHDRMLTLYCGIHKDKIDLLNQIIERTGCKIVISSAWRYMIHMGEMTYRGFEYMLVTHGLMYNNTIIGATRTDQVLYERELQIKDWLARTEHKIDRWVVVDDLNLNIENLVKTNGEVGLTQDNVNEVVRILNGI